MFFFFFDEKMTALTLANYILTRAQEKRKSVTNLKLQKILYYVQGHFLAKFDRPLFPDDIQAWTFGPVVPNVYYHFSIFGPDNLSIMQKEDLESCFLSFDEKELIDNVIDEKLQYSSSALVKATHQEQPWLKATLGGVRIKRNTVIDIEDMKSFFKNVRNSDA